MTLVVLEVAKEVDLGMGLSAYVNVISANILDSQYHGASFSDGE